MYIDIHNHGLYEVDDGAGSAAEAEAMLKAAYADGAEAVILTPHYRHGMFAYPKERIEEHYAKLSRVADEIGIKLYLGCEYHVDSRVAEAFNDGRCHTLADGEYVLSEYAYGTEYTAMVHYTRELLMNGYIPVIAHVERYECLLKKPGLCQTLSDMGALIQINADAVLGLEGKATERFCRKLLKKGWADVIASDAHGMKNRTSHMRECYEYVAKKYDADYAGQLFRSNPKKIIEL